MVERIVGLNKEGDKVFEREASEYDRGMATMRFGFTPRDIIKAVGFVFLCGTLYAGQQNINKQMLESIVQISANTKDNASAISGLKDTLYNLNNYLSSSTGKQFKDGRPLSMERNYESTKG